MNKANSCETRGPRLTKVFAKHLQHQLEEAERKFAATPSSVNMRRMHEARRALATAGVSNKKEAFYGH